MKTVILCVFGFILFVSNAFAQNSQPSGPVAQSKGLNGFGNVIGGGMRGAGFFPSPVPVILYAGSLAPERNPTATDQNRLSISIPISKDQTDIWAGTLGGENIHFSDAVNLNSGTVIPQNFYRAEVGTQFARTIDEERMIIARVSIGSASDKLFAKTEDTTFSINGLYSFPGQDESTHWAVTVFMSNNNPLINYIPIPGFIYFYRKDNFTGMFGFPFASVYWTPIERWAFMAALLGPSLTTEAIYKHNQFMQSLLGFSWGQQSFIRSDRVNKDDRVLLDEKKAYLGLRTPLTKELNSELQMGELFDRSVYEGRRFNDRRSGNAGLGNSWFVSWNFKLVI